MRNLHDDGNTLLHHKISKRDMNTTKGPVDSAPASDNSQPVTPVATIFIPRNENKMSIGFITDAAVKTTTPISAPVRHTAIQPQQQNSNFAVVKTTLRGHHDIYAKPHPSHSSQNTCTQPVLYQQPASDYSKRRKRISSSSKYSKEEDFFIMYSRLVKDMGWDRIKCCSGLLFEYRTRKALTSRYYTIRREWDLTEAGSGLTNHEKEKEKGMVLNCALHLRMEFLISIGFVHWRDCYKLCMAAGCSK